MPSAILMLVALAVVGALFVKCTVLSTNQVRSMRWRTKLRMRPGAGFASHWEITFRFSRLAALYHGRRCRPDMTFWTRLVSPARLYAVRLGRAGVRRVYARGEDQVGIVAPQRTNKSGILADRVYGHPGAAVVVSTRDDLFRLTSGHRAGQGPVLVFNPEGVGGVPSTFRPDIVADCADPEIAIRTASALAGPAEGDGDMRFWLEKSVFAIAALLHAAALLGEDMSAVWRWSQRLGDPMQEAMACPGASRELLAAALEIYKDTKSADSIRMTMAPVPGLGRGPVPAGFGLGPWGRAVRRGPVDEVRRNLVRDQLRRGRHEHRAVPRRGGEAAPRLRICGYLHPLPPHPQPGAVRPGRGDPDGSGAA